MKVRRRLPGTKDRLKRSKWKPTLLISKTCLVGLLGGENEEYKAAEIRGFSEQGITI